MKRETIIKTVMFAAFVGFIFCFGASITRAQNIRPFVDCVERERDNNGALTGKYVAHFGYIHFGTVESFIPKGLATNVMSPVRNPPNQTETFQLGVHPRAFSVTLDLNVAQTWRLTSYYVTASFDTSQLCSNTPNQNSRLMTYQGKLSDGAAAANGVYDLRFQLFNAATDGRARTTQILIEDVTVTNGIFTVQLDLGANSLIYPSGNTAVSLNRTFNSAILEGEDGFFEIGVRPGTSTGAFTTLTPRQPLTAVPLAMRADTANNAFRAAFADESKISVVNTSASANECNEDSERGKQYVDLTTLRLYICTGTGGWKFIPLQTP